MAFRVCKPVDQTIRFLGGRDARKGFGNLRRGYKFGRIHRDGAFTNEKVEEGAQRRQLASHGAARGAASKTFADKCANGETIDLRR